MNQPTEHTPSVPSRLPNVGTTIFTVMSALAAEHQAVNLGQGFPDFAGDPALPQAVFDAMSQGLNQYPPMAGVPALREAISTKIERLYGRRYDATTEITVTAGATQAILTAILSIVHAGDEVIILEPCYDSYVPNIELAGGVVVRVPLTPGSFRPDFGLIAQAITPKTRAIIINTPHNPSATIWREAEMLALQDLLDGTDILVISDEVYEHMVFDGEDHQCVARFAGLAARGLEGRLCRRARTLECRVSQGAPIQRLHRQHPGAARLGALHARPPTLCGLARVLSTQTRPVCPRPDTDPLRTLAQRRQLFSMRAL